MADLQSLLLKYMCTGLGEGNTNIDKLANQFIEDSPDKNKTELKLKILEEIKELVSSGQMQIVTTGWEIGNEFLYICSKKL